MVLAALLVSIIVAVFAGASVVYYRRSARAAENSAADSSRSADAAERSAEAAARAAEAAAATAALDADRRQAELTPRFRITVEPSNPGSDTIRLAVRLLGPLELGRLDALPVTIRDDHPWRAQRTPLAGGPTPEEVAAQICGRWRFTPGTGPSADLIKGIPGADPTGRTTPTRGLPVGEELPFQLEPTWPPDGLAGTAKAGSKPSARCCGCGWSATATASRHASCPASENRRRRRPHRDPGTVVPAGLPVPAHLAARARPFALVAAC